MVEYEKLYNDVKEMLSEKRFKHSEGVVKRALEYAEIYGVDKEKAKLSAIAHDIAKEIPKNEIIHYAKKIGVNLDDLEQENLSLPHAKIGAMICKKKYNFPEDMVNAVAYHTTGKEDMTLLEKIIYLADATEAGRNYADLEYYVDLTKKDIDRAMFEVSKWTIQKIADKEGKLHLDTVRCYNFYKKS